MHYTLHLATQALSQMIEVGPENLSISVKCSFPRGTIQGQARPADWTPKNPAQIRIVLYTVLPTLSLCMHVSSEYYGVPVLYSTV